MDYPVITPENISGAQLDTLIALVERGPLDDGEVPSKNGRDGLILGGLASRIVVDMRDGYQAATFKGSMLYCEIFGNSKTLAEAQAFRLARRAIRNAQ